MSNKNEIKKEKQELHISGSQMSKLTPAQKNIQLLRDLFHAMDTPGPESEEAMMNMLDENISWLAVPWARTLLGREKVLATVKHTWEDGSIPSHPITHVFADDEWVCVEYVLAGTKKGGTLLFRDGEVAKGKLNVPGASIFHVKNGKIDIAHEYIDLLTMFKQLGVDPQAAAPSANPV
jgi:limonene-1,2-epoxide hydrolase